MYWYEKSDDECVGYLYKYFIYHPLHKYLTIKEKYVLTHEEFLSWYENNKRM